jgi:predicted dehydrogenase
VSGDRARIAVVGAGWWSGRVHLPALTKNPDADVVAICDQDAGRAAEAARIFDVPNAVATIDEVIALGVDAVLIATPHDHHHDPAGAALDAGIDVMIEKPMTLDPREAWDLVERARTHGANLHVGYSFLHSPHVIRLRELVAAGDLGQIVLGTGLFATGVERLLSGDPTSQSDGPGPFLSRPTTYTQRAHGGGQSFTQLTHATSLLLWTTGFRAREVSAYADRRGLDVDVVDALAVSMVDGGMATLATTGTVHDHDERVEEYRLFGTEGHVTLDTKRGRMMVYRRGHGVEALPELSEYDAQPVDQTSASLVATALGRAPVVAPGEIGAYTVDVLAAAFHSARTGGPVDARPGQAPSPVDDDG